MESRPTSTRKNAPKGSKSPTRKSLKKSFLNFFKRNQSINLDATVREKSVEIENPYVSYNSTVKKTPRPFSEKLKARRTANELNKECPISNQCLAANIYYEGIKAHFNGFTDFAYMELPINYEKDLPSKNGLYYKIKYANGKLDARASARASATNNYYEAYALLKTYNYYEEKKKYEERMKILSEKKRVRIQKGSEINQRQSARHKQYNELFERYNEGEISPDEMREEQTEIAMGEQEDEESLNNIKKEREQEDYEEYYNPHENNMPDSLLYEYLVGQYINKLNKIYPCFIETYGYYRINDKKDIITLSKEEFKNSLELKDPMQNLVEELNWSCSPEHEMAILTQYFNQVETLDSFVEKIKQIDINNDEINYLELAELAFLSFQIYFPLAQLKNKFTHHYLNMKNVLLYKPQENGYIEYHYHCTKYKKITKIIKRIIKTVKAPTSTNSKRKTKKTQLKVVPETKEEEVEVEVEVPDGEEIVTFKSEYMAKIYNYGRSYFKDTDIMNSLSIYNDLSEAEKCTEKGKDKGYNQLNIPEDKPKKDYGEPFNAATHFARSEEGYNLAKSVMAIRRNNNESLDPNVVAEYIESLPYTAIIQKRNKDSHMMDLENGNSIWWLYTSKKANNQSDLYLLNCLNKKIMERVGEMHYLHWESEKNIKRRHQIEHKYPYKTRDWNFHIGIEEKEENEEESEEEEEKEEENNLKPIYDFIYMFNGIRYYGQRNKFSTYNYESSQRTKEEDAAGVGTKGYYNIVEAEKSLRFLINKKDEGLKKLNNQKYDDKKKNYGNCIFTATDVQWNIRTFIILKRHHKEDHHKEDHHKEDHHKEDHHKELNEHRH